MHKENLHTNIRSLAEKHKTAYIQLNDHYSHQQNY